MFLFLIHCDDVHDSIIVLSYDYFYLSLICAMLWTVNKDSSYNIQRKEC